MIICWVVDKQLGDWGGVYISMVNVPIITQFHLNQCSLLESIFAILT